MRGRQRLLIPVLLLVVMMLSSATPKARARTTQTWSSQEISALINGSAQEFGQSAFWMGRVLWCESGWNPGAVNPYSGAAGIAQFMWPTFNSYVWQLSWLPGTWLSPYNPAVAIRVMALMWARGRASAWSCSYIVGYLR